MDEVGFKPAVMEISGAGHVVTLTLPGVVLRLTPGEAVMLVEGIVGVFADWAGIEDVDGLLAEMHAAGTGAELDAILAKHGA